MATERLDSQRAQFLAWAGTAFERMLGGEGQNGLVTFAEREERACEVTDALARWLMAEHVAQDPVSQAGGEPLVRPAKDRCRRNRLGRLRRRSAS